MRTEDIRNMAKAYAAVQEKAKNEELKGDQHKIDANGNGKIDGHDFKMLRKKSKKETATKSTTTVSNNAKTDTDVQTQEANKLNELSKDTLGSYVKKASQSSANKAYDAGKADAKGDVHSYSRDAAKSNKRQKGIAKAIDKMMKKESVELDESTITVDHDTMSKRMTNYSAKKHNIKVKHDHAGPGTVLATGKKEDMKKYLSRHYGSSSDAKDVHPEVFKESTLDEAKKAKPTAIHHSNDETRDTWEKQLSTRKGEKDFVDQHKAETPEAGDEPKVDAMNFQKFRAMTGKISKDTSRKADNKKGDNNIVPSGTPIKDPAAPKIREQSEQLDELSVDTLKKYREKAIKDKEKTRQKLYKSGFPKMDDPDSKHKQFRDRVRKKINRDTGLKRSWKKVVDKGGIKGRKPGEYGMMLVPHQQPKGKKG